MVDNEYMYRYIKASNERLELQEENKKLQKENLKLKNEIARLNLELGKLQGKQAYLCDEKEEN